MSSQGIKPFSLFAAVLDFNPPPWQVPSRGEIHAFAIEFATGCGSAATNVVATS